MRDGDARRAIAQQGHYAGALSRLVAYGADLLILTSVYAVALALLEFAINAATPWSIDFKTGHVLVLLGELLWAALYFGNSWIVFARSPGMTLLGLRIVQADGSSLDRHHAIIRLLAFPLGFLTLGVGFLGIIFGRTHQAIYDRIARTAVVYDWDAAVGGEAPRPRRAGCPPARGTDAGAYRNGESTAERQASFGAAEEERSERAKNTPSLGQTAARESGSLVHARGGSVLVAATRRARLSSLALRRSVSCLLDGAG